MPIVFLPLNGIGLGHVSRAFAIAENLISLGQAPVIFSQGEYPDYMNWTVPGHAVGTIYKASPAERSQIVGIVSRYAELCAPSIIVDDTHPTPLTFAKGVSRVLLVRPTDFSYMRHLRKQYSNTYARIIITDHPASPTWPFTSEETDQIVSWTGWHCVGPVYRRAHPRDRELLRAKYALKQSTRLYVFTMGGGGVQTTAIDERKTFCERATSIANKILEIEPSAKLIFVRGPLFPAGMTIPAPFEEIAIEPKMPSLLSLADGAVIRPGYNTTWECLSAGTPFLPISSTTFMEPTSERLARLQNLSLAPRDDNEWLNWDWRRSFRSKATIIAEEWKPDRACAKLNSLLDMPERPSETLKVCLRAGPAPLMKWRTRPIPLCVRIDDAADLDQDILATLEICSEYGLKPSIEIIPYLCRIDENALRRAVGKTLRFEISQHGFAHVPRKTANGRKTEFPDLSTLQIHMEAGLNTIRRLFPSTFAGGYSSPYDCTPPFLPRIWRALGGKFITVCKDRVARHVVPTISLTVDPWNWIAKAPVPTDKLIKEALRAVSRDGYIGLVLHPRLLRTSTEAMRVRSLLQELVRLGARSTSISEVARMKPTPISRLGGFVDALREHKQ